MGIFDKKKKDEVKADTKTEKVKTTKKVKEDKSVAKKASKNTKKEKKQEKTVTYQATGEAYKVLLKPLISEKSANNEKDFNKYTFIVSAKATKPQIKEAIKKVYSVNPVKVNIINVKPKKVRFRGVKGSKKSFTKAVVSLKKGETIDYFKPVYK